MTLEQLWTLSTPILVTAVVGIFAWLIKKTVENLEQASQRNDARSERIETKLEKIQAFLGAVTNAIIEMQTILTGKGHAINQKLTYSPGSPLKLTEYGETMMKDSGLYEILDKHQDFFVNFVLAKNPQTKYDVQEFSMEAMRELAAKNNALLVPVKDYAYSAGLPLEVLLNTGGLILRDAVLKKFTETKIDNDLPIV